MAEPVGTKDIGDVLSSVRRLVAPEARARPLSRDLEAERLILSPAFRVVSEDDAGSGQAEAEPFWEDTWVPAVTDPLIDATVDTHLPKVDDDLGDGISSDADMWSSGPEVADEVTPAENGTLAEQSGAGSHDQPDEAPEQPEAAANPEFASLPSDPVADSVLQFPQFAEARASLMGWTDSPSIAPSDGPEPLAGLTDADGNPVTVLDEDALHDIVRSLIREELQGVMGERITQNVRKLVRAEINRALTARSLD